MKWFSGKQLTDWFIWGKFDFNKHYSLVVYEDEGFAGFVDYDTWQALGLGQSMTIKLDRLEES